VGLRYQLDDFHYAAHPVLRVRSGRVCRVRTGKMHGLAARHEGDWSGSATGCGHRRLPPEAAVSFERDEERAAPLAVQSARPVALPRGVFHQEQIAGAEASLLPAPDFDLD